MELEKMGKKGPNTTCSGKLLPLVLAPGPEGWVCSASQVPLCGGTVTRSVPVPVPSPAATRVLTVDGDFDSLDDGRCHVVGGTALVLPGLLPRDARDLQVLVLADEAHGCRDRGRGL